MSLFTLAELKELATFFNLEMPVDHIVRAGLLPVRDGHVDKTDKVWWRSAQGPEHVLAGDSSHWQNISNFPHVYSLAKPSIITIEYRD